MAPRTIAILRGARALLARGICRDAFARDERGETVATCAAEARAWSPVGALYRAAVDVVPRPASPYRERWEAIDEACAVLAAALPGGREEWARTALTRWGDAPGRTQREVLELLDGVLEAQGAKGAAA